MGCKDYRWPYCVRDYIVLGAQVYFQSGYQPMVSLLSILFLYRDSVKGKEVTATGHTVSNTYINDMRCHE